MSSSPSFQRHGFSLIESVLAIAITSVAILTIIALLPAGLDDLRLSSMRQAEGRIVQSFVADYQMKSWSTSANSRTLADKELYFDIRGTTLPNKNHIDHAITAKATVQANLPKLEGDSDANPNLRKLTIRITNRIQDPEALTDPTKYQVRTTWIANFDQVKL